MGSDMSESEREAMEFEEVDSSFIDQSQGLTQYSMDENAQDYSNYNPATGQPPYEDEEGAENSFDPDAFFNSWHQQQQASVHQQGPEQGQDEEEEVEDEGGGQQTGIATDLQLSDSEDEEEEFEVVGNGGGEESNTGFDMREFLQ